VVTAGVVAVGRNVAYAITPDGVIFALNASDGKQVWLAHVAGYLESLTVADGQVYALWDFTGYTFSAFNASTGKLLWQFQSGEDYVSLPVVANGVVYVAKGGPNTQGSLSALEAATGTVRWQVADKDMLGFQSLVLDNNVIYTTDPTNVFAFNASDGSERWHTSYPSLNIRSGPVLANGVLYIGSANGADTTGGGCEVDALSASNGARRWKITPPSPLLAPHPASGQGSPGPCSTGASIVGVFNGAVIIAQNITSVAISASNGRQLWTADWTGGLIG
jgi:outer membrane protein assembly factor BamB